MRRLFGGVIQNGYVVRNIEAAMRHWIDVLGVGPWFYIDHLPVADFQYKGQPSPVDISLLLAMGYTIGHAGSVSGRGRFVYLLTEGHPGTIVELFDMSQGRDRVFAGIAAAAHTWDGQDPIRTILPTG